VSENDKGEKLISVAELADRLGFGVDWVYDHVHDGTLPCIKIKSRAWRFHWPTVLAALQKRR
jgi:excisionase family DNA binding protein